MTADLIHLDDYRADATPTDPRPEVDGKRHPRPGFLDPIDRQCLAWILGLALAALIVIFCGEHLGGWLYVTAGGAQ